MGRHSFTVVFAIIVAVLAALTFGLLAMDSTDIQMFSTMWWALLVSFGIQVALILYIIWGDDK